MSFKIFQCPTSLRVMERFLGFGGVEHISHLTLSSLIEKSVSLKGRSLLFFCNQVDEGWHSDDRTTRRPQYWPSNVRRILVGPHGEMTGTFSGEAWDNHVWKWELQDVQIFGSVGMCQRKRNIYTDIKSVWQRRMSAVPPRDLHLRYQKADYEDDSNPIDAKCL